MTPEAADEAAHPPGRGAWWSDAWQLDLASPEGVGLTVRLECYPNRGVAWFWTYLVLPTLAGPVVVRDHEVALPRQGLEIRAEGLWSELWCETPLEHWTYGLEAFGVRLDDPADALTGETGERIPVGLDLEWELEGPVIAHDDAWPVAGYAEPGVVHGDVLLGRERFELDAWGVYHRSWGERDWQRPGTWRLVGAGPDLTVHLQGDAARAEGVIDVRDAPLRAVRNARHEAHAGAGRVVVDDDLQVEAEMLTGAPVPIDARVYLDRAPCRISAGDAVGHGWSSVLVSRDVRG
jgi:hypothetical protein